MLEIKKNIYWVGVKDWELRMFHGHELSTYRGSTYNSYLIRDEKTVLVDAVWKPYGQDFMERLEKEVGLDKIDFIVANHNEIDHSGALVYLMDKIPGTPVYCTKNGAEILRKHYHKEWNFNIVKTGDTIKTGKYELMFVEMQMLHWPDSMLTYVKGADLILSNDAFGQHYAAPSLFNDEVDECELYQEAIKYYANIIAPFGSLVRKKIEQLRELNLSFDMIAPSHGVIWRSNPVQIVDKYYEWSQDYNENTAVVVYDTMWNGTKSMAHAIAKGLTASGIRCKIFNSAETDKNELITEMFKARAIIIGCPTVNNTVLYSTAATLEELKGLKFKRKIGAGFGSFGWSGEAPKIISQRLKDAGIDVVSEPLQFKYQPVNEELEECVRFGSEFAKHI